MSSSRIEYSEKYADDAYEYRCVYSVGTVWRSKTTRDGVHDFFRPFSSRVLRRINSALPRERRTAPVLSARTWWSQGLCLATRGAICRVDVRKAFILRPVFSHSKFRLLLFLVSTPEQSRDPSKGSRQDATEKPLADRDGMAGNWRTAESRLATLRHSSVSYRGL